MSQFIPCIFVEKCILDCIRDLLAEKIHDLEITKIRASSERVPGRNVWSDFYVISTQPKSTDLCKTARRVVVSSALHVLSWTAI